MADEIDRANANAAVLLERQIAAASKVQPKQISEKCWYCGETTINGARWCNAEHRDDYEKYGAM